MVFVEDASNDEVEVLVPSRSLLVRHRWSAEEADKFHAWPTPIGADESRVCIARQARGI